MSVDYNLLREQINTLSYVIIDTPEGTERDHLEGAIHLLEYILDEGEGANLNAITEENSVENGASMENAV